jgi:hypothetical protein
MERQQHGFDYEQSVIKRFGLKNTSYTSEYDAICSDVYIQIKCIKYGSAIEMGSYKRNKNKCHNFMLIVGFWKDTRDNIIREDIYEVYSDNFTLNLQYDYDVEMFTEMTYISNLKDDDQRWAKFCAKHKQRWCSKGNNIDIRFKRDHKNQKRIQCAISWKKYNQWFVKTFHKIELNCFKQLLEKTTMNCPTQTVGLGRNTTDKYYTKFNVASQCIDKFLTIVKPSYKDIIIEPSAGAGSFSDILQKTFEKVDSYDIEPKQSHIMEADFLSIDDSRYTNAQTPIHCVGNPPFGRQSSLARRFIKKCIPFSASISFILPKSFKKLSFSKVFPQNFHKIFEMDCPSNSFEVNGKEYDVPCVFQIWVKRDVPRIMDKVSVPVGFSFVHKEDNPDFCLTRVGFSAGKATIDTAKNTQSHYFLSLIHI